MNNLERLEIIKKARASGTFNQDELDYLSSSLKQQIKYDSEIVVGAEKIKRIFEGIDKVDGRDEIYSKLVGAFRLKGVVDIQAPDYDPLIFACFLIAHDVRFDVEKRDNDQGLNIWTFLLIRT
jgi:hypothetical protein